MRQCRLTGQWLQVHALHVALKQAGFSCSSDELQWWQYGDSTHGAVQVFQVTLCLCTHSSQGDRVLSCTLHVIWWLAVQCLVVDMHLHCLQAACC